MGLLRGNLSPQLGLAISLHTFRVTFLDTSRSGHKETPRLGVFLCFRAAMGHRNTVIHSECSNVCKERSTGQHDLEQTTTHHEQAAAPMAKGVKILRLALRAMDKQSHLCRSSDGALSSVSDASNVHYGKTDGWDGRTIKLMQKVKISSTQWHSKASVVLKWHRRTTLGSKKKLHIMGFKGSTPQYVLIIMLLFKIHFWYLILNTM